MMSLCPACSLHAVGMLLTWPMLADAPLGLGVRLAVAAALGLGAGVAGGSEAALASVPPGWAGLLLAFGGGLLVGGVVRTCWQILLGAVGLAAAAGSVGVAAVLGAGGGSPGGGVEGSGAGGLSLLAWSLGTLVVLGCGGDALLVHMAMCGPLALSNGAGLVAGAAALVSHAALASVVLVLPVLMLTLGVECVVGLAARVGGGAMTWLSAVPLRAGAGLIGLVSLAGFVWREASVAWLDLVAAAAGGIRTWGAAG